MATRAKTETKKEEMVTSQRFSLPNKKIEVVPHIRPTAFINDTNHIAAFLAPGAKKTYVTPIDAKTQTFKKLLTDEEESYLGQKLRKDLSPYDPDGFWENVKITLGKEKITLDLQDPMSYIKYKVLEANSLEFCTDANKLNSKLTYKYLLRDLEDAAFQDAQESDFEEKVFELFSKVKKDPKTMFDFLSMKNIKVSNKSTDAFLIQQIRERFIKSSRQNMEEFYNTLSADDFDIRVIAAKAVRYKIIDKYKNQYMLQGEVVANSFEQLVSYLKNPKFQEAYLLIEERVKVAED